MSSSTSPAVPTKLIYQYDESLRTHLAQITTVRSFAGLTEAERSLFKVVVPENEAPETSPSVVETKETIFYAQGGGQPYDTGYMTVAGTKSRFNVEAVRYGEGGRILHFGRFADTTFGEGDMVEQHINGDRRDINSRSHTAGHIIGLAVRRLAENEGCLNITELKASHYPGASFVEFKGTIDGKFKDTIQARSTEYVKGKLPIKLKLYKPEELGQNNVITAEGMLIVAGPDGNVRVVDIVGAGAYPCGGTHVQHTGLIGNIIVKGIKRQKGISKVSYTISPET